MQRVVLFCVISEVRGNLFKTYEEGQIDALKGIQKYYLKEYPNGERYWIEKTKGDGIDIPQITDHLIN